MNKYAILIFTVSLFAGGSVAALEEPDARVTDSREAIREFADMLKGYMQRAMEKGGPVEAISTCNVEAPAVAAEVSDLKGWDIQRTSLKVRNPANKPDAWETMVLQDFERRKNMGEQVSRMEYSEMVSDESGKRVYRYMKAIPVAQGCTTCHGEKIAPEISAKLKELYPDDQATGFRTGDIRGAFTITQPM